MQQNFGRNTLSLITTRPVTYGSMRRGIATKHTEPLDHRLKAFE